MTTFSHLLRQLYLQKPEQVAVYLAHAGRPDLPVTYRQLIEDATAYAQALERQGIQPGDVVILILQHGRDVISSFFGAVLHGAIPSIMPFLTEKLLPERYRADLASLIRVTHPAAIVTYQEFEEKVLDALPSVDSVRAIIVSECVGPSAKPDFESLGGLRCSSQDIVLLQHSSGTTGLQKGVALSHRAVLNQLESYSRAIRLSLADDIIVSWLPLYHDMGLIAGFIMPILLGVPLVLLSPFDWIRAPHRLMQAISHYRGSLTWLPNFAYSFCARKIRERYLEGVDLSCWRAVINCSEPMRWESHQVFLNRFQPYGLHSDALATSYAMAENVFAVTQGGIGEPVTIDEIDRDMLQTEQVARPVISGRKSVKMLSAGSPIDNVHIRVLDKEGQDVPERHIGEIALQSDCMLTSYYHRPDATTKAFLDGWYLTGDYGYLANGQVYITGRKKDLIIVGGKNIYPQDLEQLAMEVPGVHPGRIAAFGVINEVMGTEDVILVAEVDIVNNKEREQIAQAVRQTVTRGSAVALRHVYLVAPRWLIKTSSGKIARLANRDKYLSELEEL
ncbi:MAG: fatty acyl-AMP ligase [Chloroflexi bacterium]|nr:fatty acyl-AMP ligase [Chloroflexota bacterium]